MTALVVVLTLTYFGMLHTRTHAHLLLLIIPITTDVSGATNVNLTAYGPHRGDNLINICPSDNYTLVIHCAVTDSFFLWTFEPFFSLVTFTSTSTQGARISRSSVTVILTKKETKESDFTFESQLQVFTGVLRETITERGGSPLEIQCQDSSAMGKTMSIKALGKTPRLKLGGVQISNTRFKQLFMTLSL